MTAVHWVLLLVVCMVVLTLFYIRSGNRRRRALRSLRQLEKMGMEQGLNFSAQAFLNELLVGLDGVNRKLLVVSLSQPSRFEVVCLDDLARCTLQKAFAWPQQAREDNELKRMPDRIWIEFEFRDGRPSFELPFFDAGSNDAYSCAIREQKAQDWVTVISKMLRRPLMRRA